MDELENKVFPGVDGQDDPGVPPDDKKRNRRNTLGGWIMEKVDKIMPPRL